MKIQVSQIGSVTVRQQISPRTSRKYFTVGRLLDGKWEAYRGDGYVSLTYTAKKKAMKVAAFIRANRNGNP